MSNEVQDKKKSFLREKGVEIAVGLVLTIISIFIINRIDNLDNRLRTVEMDVSSIKTTVETLSKNQGTLLGNNGDNRMDLKLLDFRLTKAEKDIEELKE